MKRELKPGNMLYPLPAVLVSCGDGEGAQNLLTIAWAGTVCSDPPMLSVSIRKDRFSHHLIEESGEFVVNLVSEKIAKAADWCGVRSGRELDKFEAMQLTKVPAEKIDCCVIAEAPAALECRVTKSEKLGSHTIFMAEVLCVQAEDQYIDENGRFCLEKAQPVVYSRGDYRAVGRRLGSFGFSVKKAKKGKNRR